MEEDQGILSYHLDRLWRKYFSEVLTTSMQSCSVPLKRNHFVVVVCLFVCLFVRAKMTTRLSLSCTKKLTP